MKRNRFLRLALRTVAPAWPKNVRDLVVGLVPDVVELVGAVRRSEREDLIEVLAPGIEAILLEAALSAPPSIHLDEERAKTIAHGLSELALWIDELVEASK